MSATPLISVIITCYNNAAYIGAAIESVLAQDYARKEIIVVDNGSSDGSLEIMRAFVPAIRLISHDVRGPGAARNRGMREASGDFFALLDGDDVWLAGKLSAQVRALRQYPSARFCCTSFYRWFSGKDGDFACTPPTPARTVWPSYGDAYFGDVFPEVLRYTHVWTSTVLLRRDLPAEVGHFDESLRLAQDLDYWCRIGSANPVLFLARPTALYRQAPSSSVRAFKDTCYAARVLERWYEVAAERNPAEAVQGQRRIAAAWRRHGYKAIAAGVRASALASLREAQRRDELALSDRLRLAMCRTPPSFAVLRALEPNRGGGSRPGDAGWQAFVLFPKDEALFDARKQAPTERAPSSAA
ncbi:MAG: glycosyltransferase family 2 protein [Geminicoccaceae bacterium]